MLCPSPFKQKNLNAPDLEVLVPKTLAFSWNIKFEKKKHKGPLLSETIMSCLVLQQFRRKSQIAFLFKPLRCTR